MDLVYVVKTARNWVESYRHEVKIRPVGSHYVLEVMAPEGFPVPPMYKGVPMRRLAYVK